ncbi:hypothetical protein QQ054_11250 [Oscillatoria amoena NRMC-F 0135]|nr:hypothetical protein [Oscillatoria amoena NRMC-F 0135]
MSAWRGIIATAIAPVNAEMTEVFCRETGGMPKKTIFSLEKKFHPGILPNPEFNQIPLGQEYEIGNPS